MNDANLIVFVNQFDVNFLTGDFSKYRVAARLGDLRSRCFISHVDADDSSRQTGSAKQRGSMNYIRRTLANKYPSHQSPL